MNETYFIKLNNEFYNKNAKEFSNTRQYSWSEWTKIAKLLKKKFSKKQFSVLDIACGNGRFYKFLLKSLPDFKIDYTGIDNNEYFLSEAKSKYEKSIFEKVDIFEYMKKQKVKFDVVVAFGITHHIPGIKLRRDFFNNLAKLTNKLLIFSIWDLNNEFLKKKSMKAGMPLEKNAWLLGGFGTKDTYRYYYKYTKEDLLEIENLLREKYGMKLIGRFEETHTKQIKNEYFVYQASSKYKNLEKA